MNKKLSILIAGAALGGMALSASAADRDAPALTDPAAFIVLAQAEAVMDYNRYYAEQVMADHDELMPMLDKNHDGMCSREEFMQAHDHVFRTIDANNDGVLSEAEMSAGYQSSAPTATN
ncbi:EF-hand domain-containing protein [Salinisphaera aquimarina]|uniref:EF-hand domain-containing protein n=1 Tax=Salinisphaera aquimarina TaxID=2094031 RepID=A0ABV7EV21_9GAMM